MNDHFQVEKSQKMSYLNGVTLEQVKIVRKSI